MVIVIGGQKGGSAKTTVAVNFAVMRKLLGRDVYIYDIDQKQNTATLWASLRDDKEIQPHIPNGMRVFNNENQPILNPGLVVRNDIKVLVNKYEDIIVDAGGGANEVFKAALSMADIIVSPINPGDFDMWTFATLDRLIGECQKREDLKGLVVLTRLSTQPYAAQEEIEECDEYLKNINNLTRLENYMHTRKPIRKASGSGLAIIEALPEEDKAVCEIKAIYEEVFNGK